MTKAERQKIASPAWEAGGMVLGLVPPQMHGWFFLVGGSFGGLYQVIGWAGGVTGDSF